MKIEIIHPCIAAKAHQDAGTILDLPDQEAAAVISTGRGRRVAADPAPAAEPPALETATAAPATEAAARRTTRAKRTATA